MVVFTVEQVRNEHTYGVKNAQGYRIAVCYTEETARIVAAALNAYRLTVDSTTPGLTRKLG